MLGIKHTIVSWVRWVAQQIALFNNFKAETRQRCFDKIFIDAMIILRLRQFASNWARMIDDQHQSIRFQGLLICPIKSLSSIFQPGDTR